MESNLVGKIFVLVMHKVKGILQLVVSGFDLIKYDSILIATIILGSN